MKDISVYDHITSNNWKTFFLVLLFPLLFIIIFFIAFYIAILLQKTNDLLNFGLSLYSQYFTLNENLNPNQAQFLSVLGFTYLISIPIIIATVIWSFISYRFGDNMMLSFAGATEISREDKEYGKVYRTVEDVAIKSGLPFPKVYLIDDESLNAFATGRNPLNSSIALSKGIISKLNNLELEGVIAHEMAHIGNRDIRLNMMIITGIGVFGFLADILYRTVHIKSNNKSSKDKENLIMFVVLITWIVLIVFNFLIAPIIRFAISRTREYNADITGALITRNPEALASALEKISMDSRIEILDKKKSMGIACIADPNHDGILKGSKISLGSLDALNVNQTNYSNHSSKINSFFATHPSIESRIERLRGMNNL